jgi:hypothetical protein
VNLLALAKSAGEQVSISPTFFEHLFRTKVKQAAFGAEV